jgi:hypothetical protein
MQAENDRHKKVEELGRLNNEYQMLRDQASVLECSWEVNRRGRYYHPTCMVPQMSAGGTSEENENLCTRMAVAFP